MTTADESTGAPQEPPTERTRLRRIAEKARYDRSVIDAILDDGLVAHVGLATDDGPVVIPMAYARDGDRVLLHGSVASRLLRAGASGLPVCVTITLLDGMVVARSLFESSMAYRSVVVFGRAAPIDDPEEKLAALVALSDRLLPGRTAEARRPNERELAQTKVLAVPLDEASAKVSDDSISDDPDDLSLPIWAGFLPFRTVVGPPEPAPDLAPGIALPPSLAAWPG